MAATDRRGALLAGFTLPDDEFERVSSRSPILLTQTQTFATNLMQTLEEAGYAVSLVSFAQVTNFPEHPQLIFRSRRFTFNGADGQLLGFLNLLVLKHLTRSFMLRTRGLRAAKQARPSVIVVHGVHRPLLKFALRLKRRFGVTAVAVLTDPPGVVRDGDGRLVRWLRRRDAADVRRLLRRFDRVLALTEALANDFADGVPSLIFPGFAPQLAKSSSDKPVTAAFSVAYAGGLSEAYGVGDLIRAIRAIEDPRMRLDIYGSGPLAAWVDEQAEQDSRIRFKGVVAREELLSKLADADILVNPRRLDYQALRYSFPSKLMEYMALGVPTLSTPIPGIPPELLPHLVLAESDGDEELRRQLLRVATWAREERVAFGESARECVLGKFGPTSLGSRLKLFLRGDSCAIADQAMPALSPPAKP